MLSLLIYFFCGAAAGSFFYTLALRYIDGSMKENALRALMSRSKCPLCGTNINPLYLTPILGFILLGGKCRRCHNRISPAYPAAEILCGVLAAAFVKTLGLSSITIFAYLLACISLCISVVDIRTKVIPISLVLAFFLMSLWPAVYRGTPLDNGAGLLLMGIFFAVVLFIFPGSFGGGDVKLAAAIGFYSGIAQSVIVLEAALIIGAIFGVIWTLISGKGRKASIPFAPFLSAGLIISMLWGNRILLLYYSAVL